MTCRIHAGHTINKHISILQSWDAIPPISSPCKGAARWCLSPGEHKAYKFSCKGFKTHGWSSWILLSNLATTPSDQRYLCTCLRRFSRSRAKHSARSKPSPPSSSGHLWGCAVPMGLSMHLHNHLMCLQRLLLRWARDRQTRMMCAMQNTGAQGSSVASLYQKMQPNHHAVTGMWNEASRLYELLLSFISVLVLLCPNRGQDPALTSPLFSSGFQSLLDAYTTALSVGYCLSQNCNPQYFRAISMFSSFLSWTTTSFPETKCNSPLLWNFPQQQKAQHLPSCCCWGCVTLPVAPGGWCDQSEVCRRRF